MTAAEVLTKLRGTYERATADGQHGPAAKCAELLGKSVALFTDVTVEKPYRDLTDEELVAKVLEALGGVTK